MIESHFTLFFLLRLSFSSLYYMLSIFYVIVSMEQHGAWELGDLNSIFLESDITIHYM